MVAVVLISLLLQCMSIGGAFEKIVVFFVLFCFLEYQIVFCSKILCNFNKYRVFFIIGRNKTAHDNS